MDRVLFFLCTVWVVLFNNSRIAEDLPTYGVLRFFPVPRQVRFVEVLALLVLLVGCMRLPKSPLVRRVNGFTFAFLAVAIIGLLPGFRLGGERLQEVYIRAVPLLMFAVAATLGVTRQQVRSMGVIFLAVLGVSIVTAVVYQIPFYGWHEDHIHGIYSDAHIFGTMVGVAAVACLSEFIETRRLRYAIGAAALFAFQFYPRNGKVVLLCGVWFGLVLIKEYVLTRGWLARVAAIVLGLISLVVIYDRVDDAITQQSALRLHEVAEYGVYNLGPFAAWPIAVSAMAGSAFTVLFGLGAGEYGWLAAFRAMALGEGTAAAQTFALEFSLGNVNNAGYLFRTNTWSSLLAEFGVVGFVGLMGGAAVVTHGALRTPGLDRFDRSTVRIFTFGLAAVVFQGCFTPFSNWSESILMFPLVYVAAYLAGPRDEAAAAEADAGPPAPDIDSEPAPPDDSNAPAST